MGNDHSGFEAGDLIYRQFHGAIGGTTNASHAKIGWHYGIYIGDDKVVHFTKEDSISKCSVSEFAMGYGVSKERIRNGLPKEMIVQIALYLDKNPEEWGEYALLTNNCEHFARFCATGRNTSDQVDFAMGVGELGVKIAFEVLGYWLGARDGSDLEIGFL